MMVVSNIIHDILLCFLTQISSGKAVIVLNSDQEAAVGKLAHDSKTVRSASMMVVEYSPVSNANSNGMIERIGMSDREQVEVMRSVLESK